MKEFQIKALTYPEQRLEYFKAQIESTKRSLDWWQNHAASRGYNWMDINDRCSELGARISFYQDAINAIEFFEAKGFTRILAMKEFDQIFNQNN